MQVLHYDPKYAFWLVLSYSFSTQEPTTFRNYCLVCVLHLLSCVSMNSHVDVLPPSDSQFYRLFVLSIGHSIVIRLLADVTYS